MMPAYFMRHPELIYFAEYAVFLLLVLVLVVVVPL